MAWLEVADVVFAVAVYVLVTDVAAAGAGAGSAGAIVFGVVNADVGHDVNMLLTATRVTTLGRRVDCSLRLITCCMMSAHGV